MNFVSLARPFAKKPLAVSIVMFMPINGPAYEGFNNSGGESLTILCVGDLSFNSRYVRHGTALSEGAVMEHYAWASALDFTFEIEGNFVLNEGPNQDEFGVSMGALNVAEVGLTLSCYPKDLLYIRPHVGLSSILDNNLGEGLDDPMILNVGLAVGTEFQL